MATARAHATRRAQGARGLAAAAGSFRATNPARSRVRVFGGSGDYHADRWSRRVLRELSQDLVRNAECYDIFLTGTARLLGAPTPRPTSSSEAWNQQVARRWKGRAMRSRGGFDSRGLQSWHDLCPSWWTAWLRDGDIATIPLDDGTVATVTAEQIDSPTQPGNQHHRTLGGLTMTRRGDVVKVWVAPLDARGRAQLPAAHPWAADEVNLLAWRPDNTYSRGIPILTSGLDNAERIDGLIESEVVSAEQASNLYGALERQLAAGQVATAAPLSGIDDSGSSTGSPAPDERDQVDYVSFPSGSYLDLPPGLKWTNLQPQRPNLDVPEFMRQLLAMSCAKVGIPYAVIYCDFKGVNWSGNRGLVSLTRDALSGLRASHLEPFVDPLYAWDLGRGLATGELRPPAGMSLSDLTAHAWDWPDRPEWPDPHKEERRHELALSQYTDSLHRIIGPDWLQRITERLAELEAIDAAQLARVGALHESIVAAGLADALTWRDIIALSSDRAPERAQDLTDAITAAQHTATDQEQ